MIETKRGARMAFEALETIWRKHQAKILVILGLILYFFDAQIRSLATDPKTAPNFQILGVLALLAGAFSWAKRKRIFG